MVQKTDGNGDGSGSEEKRARAVSEPETYIPQPVKIKVIRKEGVAILVEWWAMDGENPAYFRGCVPPEEIIQGTVDQLVLDAAIPIGVPWDDIIPTRTPSIVNELRRHGIWTADDLLANANKIGPALQKAILLPLVNELRTFAHNERKKQINQEDL